MRIKMTLAVAILVGSTLTAQAGNLLGVEEIREPNAPIVIVEAGPKCGLICFAPLLLIPFALGSGGGT